MAYKTGTATDYKDLLQKAISFITGQGESTVPSFTGTGDGTLEDLSINKLSDSEVWTLTTTNATKVGVADLTTSIASSSPILHWRMNAVSGVVEQDTTVNNLDGTIVGTPTLASTGLLSVDTDTSMTFDGIDDQVKSAASVQVQLGDVDASISIAIQPNSLSGLQFIAGVGADGATEADNYLISLWMDEGYIKILHEYSTELVQEVTTSLKAIVGRKTYLTLSRDAANKNYKLYNGGLEKHSFDYLYQPSGGSNSFFMVGLDAAGAYPFSGIIDEVALYDSTILQATAATQGKDAFGHETFSVVGATSGAQTETYAGVPYSNDYISFEVVEGAIAFIVSDNFTTTATANPLGTQAWTINRQEKDHTVFLQGTGLSGTENIYISLELYENTVDDYYNIKIVGSDGYSSINTSENQPNACPAVYCASLDTSVTYWFFVSGRRFIIVNKVSTTYHSLYAGFMLPYATPSQYPNPVIVAGSMGRSYYRWSETDIEDDFTHANYIGNVADPARDTMYLRHPGGSWEGISNVMYVGTDAFSYFITSPYAENEVTFLSDRAIRRTISDPLGNYPLTPITIIKHKGENAQLSLDSTNLGLYGEIDGVFQVAGFSNAAENTVTVGADTYIVFQDVYRTDNDDYFAIKQE